MSITKIKENKNSTSIFQKTLQYIKRTKEEIENTPVADYDVSILRGAINSGMWGTIVADPIVAISSIAGSSIGTIVGSKTKNPLISLLASSLSSAAIFSTVNIALGNNNIIALAIGSTIASLASNIGSLTSTTSKEINHSNNFGLKLLPITLINSAFPTISLISIFSSQLPYIFEINENKKLLISILTSLSIGFSLGLSGGITNAAILAAISSILTTINFKFSSKVENFLNKISNFISNKVSSFLQPKLSFLSRLPNKMKAVIASLILGGFAGLSTATLASIISPIIGPLALALPISAFLLTSFLNTKKILKNQEIQKNTFKYLSQIEEHIEKDNLPEAVKFYKELIINNIKNSSPKEREEILEKINSLSYEQLKNMMLNELYNMYILHSIKYFNENLQQKSIEKLKKAIIIENIAQNKNYQESKNLADSLSHQEIITILQHLTHSTEEKNQLSKND